MSSQSCEPPKQSQFINFYKNNRLKYGLIIPTSDLLNLDCKYIVTEIDDVPFMLMWINLPLLSPTIKNPSVLDKENLDCELMLRKDPKNHQWEFANDAKIPNFESTCNQILIKESEDQNLTINRLSKLVHLRMQMVLEKIDVTDYPDELEFAYLGKIMNIDNLSYYIYLRTFTNIFNVDFAYLLTNFPDITSNVIMANAGYILDSVETKYEEHYDSKIKKTLFENLKSNSDYMDDKKYQMLIIFNFLLDVDIRQRPINPIHLIKYVTNLGANDIKTTQFFEFIQSYHQQVKEDQGLYEQLIKNLDLNATISGFTIKHTKTNQAFLIDHFVKLEAYNLKFYVFELFEAEGYFVEPKAKGGYSSFKNIFTKTSNCNLKDEEKIYFINLALKENWLNSDLFYSEKLLDIFKKCHKYSYNQEQYFSILVKPSNSKNCEFLVKRTQMGEHEDQFKDVIISDTSTLYWYGITCIRYTRNLQVKKELIKQQEIKNADKMMNKSFSMSNNDYSYSYATPRFSMRGKYYLI